ncbi:hypothetical protein LSCM1_00819 [Leishmania martiniquensis]|uniref:RING-type domain-containing protein n=1 Tax=Leishmania martiniquensis TaxID=1580590 RepID=A0A836GJK1_9TRYP|nr:hypothetical protein LSCM1_00819 [Leishmania martiniquensis]
MTRLSTSPPAQPPQHHQGHDQAPATASSLWPSPMSLVNFSFTQFFASLGEGSPEQWHATTEATASAPACAISAESNVPSAAISPTTKPFMDAVNLSLRDCVLLKLSLTCAICGGLLRRRPAAIETCGHCFCYDCINDALEKGCTPRMVEWPWCTLEKEVGAAEVRWASATAASASAESLHRRTLVETPGGAAQITAEFPGGPTDRDEVQAAAPPGPPTALSSTAPQSGQPRTSRKVRQVCPLCLGPAFKWMLVSLQPLADLCNTLRSAYPGLEEALGQLTASALNSGAGATASRGAPVNREDKGGPIDSDAQQQVPPTSASANIFTAALTAGPSLHGADAQCSIQGGEDGEGDEEAERRRRRSSGGPRKGITFAADIASRVPKRPAAVTAAHLAAIQTSDPVADVVRAVHCGGVEAINDDLSSTAEAGEQEGGVERAALASTLQLSADLIPSPGSPAPAFSVATRQAPCHTLSHRALQGGAELSVLTSAQLCRDDVLGSSPAETSEDEDARLSRKESRDSMASLLFAPTNQHAMASLGPSHVAADTNASQSALAFLEPQCPLPLLLDAAPALPDRRSVPWSVGASRRRTEETGGLTPPPTPVLVLLDSIDVILHARVSSIPGWSVIWDGDNEGKGIGARGCGEGCPTTLALESRCSYSSIRVADTSDDERAVAERGRGSSDANHKHRRPAPMGALSRAARRSAGAELASAHAHDIWELDTALVCRHTLLPSCFAVLRHGRVRWQASVTAEVDGSQPEAGPAYSGAGHLHPPIMYVVGQYSQQSPVPRTSASSGLHLRPTFTPAACTALVLGVPCVDMTFFSSPTSLPGTAHAVSEGPASTTVFAGASLPFGCERQRPKAIQEAWKRRVGASSASTKPQCLAEPRPVSRMVTPPQDLLARVDSNTPACDTQGGVHAAEDTYLCFLLPDGATRQLGEMLYHQWARGESAQPQQAEDASPLTAAPCLSSSRKRRRGAVRDSGVTQGISGWSVTDGHPQRAWRRLLLVAGGAAVELSGTLFEALVATAAALEGGDRTAEEGNATDTDPLLNSLAAHLLHERASDAHNLWIHVDLADSRRESSPPLTTNLARTPGPPHRLFLLYSTAVARSVFEGLVETDICGKWACTSPSSASQTLSPPPRELDAARTCRYLRRFKTFLDHLAALVALVAAPALPDSAAAPKKASRRAEARPSSWLLENIAQGCHIAEGNVTTPQPSETPDSVGGGTVASIVAKETRSRENPTAQERPTASLPIDESNKRQESEAAPPSLQQVGVYRSLLYADTP